MNEFSSQLTLALVVPYVLQWLKGQSWFPLVSYYSGKLNASVAFLIAALGGLGIGIHYNGTLHELTVTGLTMAGIWTGLQHVVQQWLMQHAAYRTLIAPPQPGAVQSSQRAVNTVAGTLQTPAPSSGPPSIAPKP